jgi:hypothetical protein
VLLCCLDPPPPHCQRQYGGTLQLDDFASHSEPDEYVFSITADATGQPEKRELYKGVVASLYPAIVDSLQRVTQDMMEEER